MLKRRNKIVKKGKFENENKKRDERRMVNRQVKTGQQLAALKLIQRQMKPFSWSNHSQIEEKCQKKQIVTTSAQNQQQQ